MGHEFWFIRPFKDCYIDASAGASIGEGPPQACDETWRVDDGNAGIANRTEKE
jgi:hypothetical protein